MLAFLGLVNCMLLKLRFFSGVHPLSDYDYFVISKLEKRYSVRFKAYRGLFEFLNPVVRERRLAKEDQKVISVD